MSFLMYKDIVLTNLKEFAKLSQEIQYSLDYCSKFLERVKDCDEYKYDTCYCPVFINFFTLKDASVILSDMLIKEMLLFQRFMNQFITQNPVQNAQIETPIVIKTFPNCDINTKLEFGFFSVSATLFTLYPEEKYIRNSLWKCPQITCDSYSIERGLPKDKKVCKFCCSPLEEDITARSFGNLYKAKFIFKNNYPQADPIIYFYDARKCNVSFELGAEYHLSGYRKLNKIEAWGISKINNSYYTSNNFMKVQNLWIYSMNDPWAFTSILINSIARNYLPNNYIWHFRLVILLSLASIRSAKPISILAISSDARILEKIMTESLKYAHKSINPTLGVAISVMVKDNDITAGQLLLGKNGICFLGDWMSYKPTMKKTILKTIEMNSVPLEDGSLIPCNSIVWTYATIPHKKNEKEQLFTMHKSFGLIWKVEPSMEEIELITDNILQDKQCIFEIEDEDILSYLQYVNTLEVTVSEDALNLLQKYFVCTRLARGEALPLTSLDPITSLAEAHARINQRNFVLIDDVLIAIYLCEYSLGVCPTIRKPPPTNIMDFKEWLENDFFPDYKTN